MNVFPLLPKLTLNRHFVQHFLAQDAPCFALAMVEERRQLFAGLALRLDVSLPPGISARGLNLGHSLLGSAHFEVLHLTFEFYGFETYHVLLNPNNPVVQAVVASMIDRGGYFILALGREREATAFRADVDPGDLIGWKNHIQRIRQSATTEAHYETALAHFRRRPDPPGRMLDWVCRDHSAGLNPSLDPLELSPASPRGPTPPNAGEPRVLAERLEARVQELSRAGVHDIELLVGMAEQMPLFKRLLDMAGPEEFSALCEAYPGLHRYARVLETIASGIASGDIEVPR
jgi:hypothetical protein